MQFKGRLCDLLHEQRGQCAVHHKPHHSLRLQLQADSAGHLQTTVSVFSISGPWLSVMIFQIAVQFLLLKFSHEIAKVMTTKPYSNTVLTKRY